MQILCGTDIIEIKRIKEGIEELGDNFTSRIFTEKEIEYCEQKKKQKFQHYAARFTAKEAVFKALSKMLENKFDLTWKNIEITNEKDGRPMVTIIGISIKGIESIDLSMSHCKEYAVATAIAVIK